MWDDTEADGDEDVEAEADDEAPEAEAADGAGDDPAVVDADPALLPACARPAADPEPLDEHPATAANTAAIAPEAIPKRFPIMLFTSEYSRCSPAVNAE
jgi:hypothetical protein